MKRYLLQTVETIAAVQPIGAAIIFALAYVAAYIGPAAALIVIAFLVGLHFAKRPQLSAAPDVQLMPALPTSAPSSPILDAIANELKLTKIEFKAPSAPRARKPQTVAAV